MLTAKEWLLVCLGAITVVFVGYWIRRLRADAAAPGQAEAGTEVRAPNPIQVTIGFVTDFLDTLGIGSFATTTASFRALKACPDRLIPGTLNIGHTIPTVLQAFIYTQLVEVDATTLIAMIGAAVAGAWAGAGLVAGLPRRKVQLGMGGALLVAGAIILMRTVSSVGNVEGTVALTGAQLAMGVAGNFVLGALMTIGVGLYAPCMVLVALLGMKSGVVFPIMMGSCAFLMPLAGARFIQKRSYSPAASLGLTIGGLPAVALAAWLVTSLPLNIINWLVIAVILYTSFSLLRDSQQQSEEGKEGTN